MTSSHGQSGAVVHVVNDSAIKVNWSAPARVVEQGEWLKANAAPNLPTVQAILPSGYIMERLTPVATANVELGGVLAALQACVWNSAPVNLVNTPETLLKVSLILDKHAPELLEAAVEQLAYIRSTVDCLTHGDPTAENVMLRNESEYVLIDPLPSTEAIPDDMAVDVGKLLQSAHGWESMKGEQRASFVLTDVANLVDDDNVFEVAELWCIVHFIRTLPYIEGTVKKRVVNKLHELLGLRR